MLTGTVTFLRRTGRWPKAKLPICPGGVVIPEVNTDILT